MRPMMHTVIKSSFWADDDIHALGPHEKLAALWLLTNDDVTHAGVIALRRAKFTFDSGLPFEALERALQALPRAFVRFGDDVWARNFIRHQWPEESLTKNNCSIAICRSIVNHPNKAIMSAVLDEYPELRDVLTEMFKRRAPKGSPSPPEGGRGEERSRDVLGGGAGEGVPLDSDVIAWAEKWPGEPATGLSGPIPASVVAACLSRWNTSSYGWPPDWRRAIVSDYRKARTGGEKNAPKKSGISDSVAAINERKEREALQNELDDLVALSTTERETNMAPNLTRLRRIKELRKLLS